MGDESVLSVFVFYKLLEVLSKDFLYSNRNMYHQREREQDVVRASCLGIYAFLFSISREYSRIFVCMSVFKIKFYLKTFITQL